MINVPHRWIPSKRIFLGLVWIVALCGSLSTTAFLYAKTRNPQPIVTGSIGGQLGNQLFVVAATLAHAWDHRAHPCFPDFNLVSPYALKYKFAFHRDRIFFRLDTSQPRPFIHEYHEPFFYCTDPIPFQIDQRITGVFQALNLFHHHRDRILSLLAPSEVDFGYLRAKYGELISLPNTVSVHIRTFDENCHQGGLYFLGLEYLKKAMDLFSEDAVFVIFSDRINWCKVHLSPWRKNFVFIEGNDEVQDLFLISMMRHHIIANSTYSWWGAYLDTRKDTKVIAPTFWVNPQKQKVHPKFYPPEWQTVDANFNAPYPKDMRDYDERSLSVDTQ